MLEKHLLLVGVHEAKGRRVKKKHISGEASTTRICCARKLELPLLRSTSFVTDLVEYEYDAPDAGAA